jgi:hypothetical protein
MGTCPDSPTQIRAALTTQSGSSSSRSLGNWSSRKLLRPTNQSAIPHGDRHPMNTSGILGMASRTRKPGLFSYAKTGNRSPSAAS